MPSLDHTGPFGEGAMTGRGLGLCKNSANRNLINNKFYGRRRGGRGRGRENRYRLFNRGRISDNFDYYENISTEEEKQLLKNQANLLEKDIKEINKRIEEIENENEKESNK